MEAPSSTNWFWVYSLCWAGMMILLPWFSRCMLMGLLRMPDDLDGTAPVAVAGGCLKTLVCRVGRCREA